HDDLIAIFQQGPVLVFAIRWADKLLHSGAYEADPKNWRKVEWIEEEAVFDHRYEWPARVRLYKRRQKSDHWMELIDVMQIDQQNRIRRAFVDFVPQGVQI